MLSLEYFIRIVRLLLVAVCILGKWHPVWRNQTEIDERLNTMIILLIIVSSSDPRSPATLVHLNCTNGRTTLNLITQQLKSY